MKSLTIILAVLLLMTVCPNISAEGMMFGGVRLQGDALAVTYGIGTPITSRIMLVESVDAGQTGNWASDIMATWHVWKGFHVGVLGGPEVEWGNGEDTDESPLTYLVGAAGGIISYDFGILGLSVAGKYRDDFKSTTSYVDRTEFGLLIFMGL